MSDSFLAQKLISFVDPSHPEPICAQPFVFYVNGQAWSVAASGPWLYAVRGTSSYAQRQDAAFAKSVLAMMPSFPIEVQTQQLRSWVGPVPTEKTFDTETRPEGVVFGKVFDLRRLAVLLHEIPFPRLQVWDSTTAVGVPSIALESKGKWRAVLAAVEGAPEADHPVLDFAM